MIKVRTVMRSVRTFVACVRLRTSGRPDWRRAPRQGVAAAVGHRQVSVGVALATIIDIGAHPGQSLVAPCAGPPVDAVCFERLPWGARAFGGCPRGRLTRHCFAGRGDCGGCEASLYVAPKTDSSSVLPILKSQVEAPPPSKHTRSRWRTGPPTPCLSSLSGCPPGAISTSNAGERDVLAGTFTTSGQVDAAFVEC